MPREKAILIGLQTGTRKRWELEDSLSELRQIAEASGASVTDILIQRRQHPDPAVYIGSGKVSEIAELTVRQNASLVIFNEPIKPIQQRNLEAMIKVKILDRPGLILDLFAHRARTNEGKLQVELAQLNYLLPRLTGKGVLMSRLGGGIGTRGPGETKLETDRRRIRHRINQLNSAIEKLKTVRGLYRSHRHVGKMPLFALVGYTNAGKTSLLNILTRSKKYADNMPFATLDPATRRLVIPDQKLTILLTDTVGFIRDLPTELSAAFRATLEEIQDADALIHVVDSAHPHREEQMRTVRKTLQELGAADKPTLLVFNKCDKAGTPLHPKSFLGSEDEFLVCSALTGQNIPQLIRHILMMVPDQNETRLFIPYAKSSLLYLMHTKTDILEEKYVEKGIDLRARIPLFLKPVFEPFQTKEKKIRRTE